MTANRKALIIGASGQDGAHMAKHLLDDGWQVYCGFRRGSSSKTWRLNQLEILNRVSIVNINIDEPFGLMDEIKSINPEHIYHFAGESFVADSFNHPTSTLHANTLGTLNVLEAIRHTSPHSRLFFASSSEIFGPSQEALLNETSKIQPSNPYGISKMTAQELVRLYREVHGLHAIVGILFNHEGPLRGRNFVTRKITYNLARLKLENNDPVDIGSLSSSRDWGSAEDYTWAMLQVMKLNDPEDFVFATGQLTSVREFFMHAATAAGFDPVFEGFGLNEICFDKTTGKLLANVAERYFRPFDTSARAGDSNKLKNAIHWKGSRSIVEIANEMVLIDIERRKKGIINV